MSLVFWIGVVFWAGSGLYGFPIFARCAPIMAGITFVAGAVCVTGALRVRSRQRVAWPRLGLWVLNAVAAQLLLVPVVYLLGSRFHDLPGLAGLSGWLLDLAGFSTFVESETLYVRTSSHLLPFTCSWEKWGVLPCSWIFAGGGILLVALRPRRLLLRLVLLGLALAVFAVVRFVALVVLAYEHPDPRGLQFPDFGLALFYFQNPTAQLLSFLPAGLFLAVLVPLGRISSAPAPAVVRWRSCGALACALLLGSFVAAAYGYQDPGERKAGRILLDEVHSSEWETATQPFGTQDYGRNSVYNYATLRAFLDAYYDVEVHTEGSYSDSVLERADLLILKTATVPFETEEVDAIESFVRDGGGLYLIGDHTNLLGMSTNLNKVARRFGMEFRLDAVNRLDDGQLYQHRIPWLFAHPVSAWMDELDFMTSCSVKVTLAAEEVLLGSNVFSDPVDYSAPSFFGNVLPDLEDPFGVHVLSASRKVGSGRVLAFSDSTIFSNFAVLQGQRPELLLGSMEYLNRRNFSGYFWNGLLAGCASLALLSLLFLLRRNLWLLADGAMLAVVSGGVLGCFTTQLLWRSEMTLPPPKPGTRTIALLEGGDYSLPPALIPSWELPQECYDVFFVWLQRLGHFPREMDLAKCLQAEIMVILNPTADFPHDDLEDLERWVRCGGRLLVMDSLWNEDSTANRVLGAFRMSVVPSHRTLSHAPLAAAPANEELAVQGLQGFDLRIPALAVQGGQPLWQTADGHVLVSQQTWGEGQVVGLVDASMFSRAEMGEQTEEVPEGDPREGRFDLQYTLFREIFPSVAKPTP